MRAPHNPTGRWFGNKLIYLQGVHDPPSTLDNQDLFLNRLMNSGIGVVLHSEIAGVEIGSHVHNEYMVVANLAMMDRKLNYLGAADMTAVSFYYIYMSWYGPDSVRVPRPDSVPRLEGIFKGKEGVNRIRTTGEGAAVSWLESHRVRGLRRESEVHERARRGCCVNYDITATQHVLEREGPIYMCVMGPPKDQERLNVARQLLGQHFDATTNLQLEIREKLDRPDLLSHKDLSEEAWSQECQTHIDSSFKFYCAPVYRIKSNLLLIVDCLQRRSEM
ncbi:hypothetical protein B0H13DRAFT_1874346 [Mycena leptocephala]|nr:hypothetical protein B0H13DRAFT_1874346 [Mycena leptocephala]